MSNVREDELSSDIIVISEKRAGRPHVHGGERKKMAACPFCPGNESMTPPTIMQVGEPWTVRCFRNKFPVFTGRDGMHEVVVDARPHSASVAGLPAGQVAKMLTVCSKRSDWMLVHGMRYALVCKNSGITAGASLSHSHSQIFGMPFTPPRVASELAALRRYRNEKGACALCDETRHAGKRKIMETENFVATVPAASKWQYGSRIIPKKHAGRLSKLYLTEMARVLKALVSAYHESLGGPDYNYYIHSAPNGGNGLLHLHLDIFPRLGVQAGLEEGAGVFINQVPPEKAARVLREKLHGKI